ncbi:MAG: SPOR domain-containing protein [Pseudomonadales bacterium]|nr:SPOR domain-containing protein [Pseudomonadales bacterium]
MEAQLRQRIIGALVLTAIAVIALPLLFDGNADERARAIMVIPNPPDIELKSLTIAEVKQAMLAMEQESARRLPVYVALEDQVDNSAENTSEEVEFQLDTNGLPISWNLKLGSFRERQNAIKLRQSLRDQRYKAFILTADTSEGEMYRVFVGPVLSRSELMEFAVEIEARFKLKGPITRFRIADDAHQLGG